jgi:histidine triad (HIT) family protein
MENCIFCKIVKGEVSTELQKETANLIVFKDIHPTAPFHWLIVPKVHYTDVSEVTGELFEEIRNIAIAINEEQQLNGFQMRVNYGKYLEVPHVHFHIVSKF